MSFSPSPERFSYRGIELLDLRVTLRTERGIHAASLQSLKDVSVCNEPFSQMLMNRYEGRAPCDLQLNRSLLEQRPTIYEERKWVPAVSSGKALAFSLAAAKE
jgi:hypothetical protein